MTTTWKSNSCDETYFVIDRLAEMCAAVSCAPDHVLDAARRTLVDTIGVAAAGAATAAGRASFVAAPNIWGNGDCSLWFSEIRSTVAGAAFVNATYAAALDLDDGHRRASGHPAAAIVPAVLACGEHLNASADKILTAIALGYEVAVRVAGARDINALRTTDSGLWCGYGVAAAAAWLSGAPVPVMAQALAIAGQTSTSQAGTGFTKIGHTVKEGIAWATANGLQAVVLASAGHRGPLDMLDDTGTYTRATMVEALSQRWMIAGAYFKLYSCCRWAHAAIDAALALKARMNIDHDDVDALLIETFERALSLPNAVRPQSSEAAQYSIPFCVALALVHGEEALLPLQEGHLADPAVLALSQRVNLVTSQDYASAFPVSTPARVTIVAKGQLETEEVLAPKGEPQNPLTNRELAQKFLILSEKSPLCGPLADKLLEVASRLGVGHDPSDLYQNLRVTDPFALQGSRTEARGKRQSLDRENTDGSFFDPPPSLLGSRVDDQGDQRA